MKILTTFLILILVMPVIAATDPKVAYALVKEGKAVMVDVREKNEIQSGMIDRAIWFPKSKITSDSNWKKDFEDVTHGKKIFLYCRSGKRSAECEEILRKNGIQSESIGGYEQLKTVLPLSLPSY